MYERSYGSEYDSSLTTKEIAAIVRKRLRAMLKAGDLPLPEGNDDVKISVRTSYGSMCSSIEREVKNFTGTRSEFRTLAKAIDAVVAGFNHDGSDTMTDYFDVNFYGSTSACWKTSEVTPDPCPNGCESTPEVWTGYTMRCSTCDLVWSPGMASA